MIFSLICSSFCIDEPVLQLPGRYEYKGIHLYIHTTEVDTLTARCISPGDVDSLYWASPYDVSIINLAGSHVSQDPRYKSMYDVYSDPTFESTAGLVIYTQFRLDDLTEKPPIVTCVARKGDRIASKSFTFSGSGKLSIKYIYIRNLIL